MTPAASTLTVDGPHPLRGRIRVPGDKSISHRALLCAALAGGASEVSGLSDGDDVVRTARAVEAMGARRDGDRITGGRLREPAHVVDVGNSGTGIRLLAGVAAAQPFLTVLTGDASIGRRPMDRIADPLRTMGARIDGRDDGRFAPLVIRGGGLAGIRYRLPVASAQVKSAVLFAGLGAEGETIVEQPVPTRAHTEELFALAGVDVTVDGEVVRLRPGRLRPFRLTVPGDPSQAAFWLVAAAIVPGSDVTVEDVYVGPARSGFLDVLDRMGAGVERQPTGDRRATLRCRAGALAATTVSGLEVPGLVDEVPVLAVAAAVAEGTTVFEGLAELRLKESDRMATTVALLRAMGGQAEADGDRLVVTGAGRLRAGLVEADGDHRIAMAGVVVRPGRRRVVGGAGLGVDPHQLPHLLRPSGRAHVSDVGPAGARHGARADETRPRWGDERTRLQSVSDVGPAGARHGARADETRPRWATSEPGCRA